MAGTTFFSSWRAFSTSRVSTASNSFLTAVRAGSRLVAEAQEIRQGRRAGFYQVSVTTQEGTLVAHVHCVAHRVPPVDGPRGSG